jgi:hypothetical protein
LLLLQLFFLFFLIEFFLALVRGWKKFLGKKTTRFLAKQNKKKRRKVNNGFELKLEVSPFVRYLRKPV